MKLHVHGKATAIARLLPAKLLTVMRLTAFILLTASLHVSAASYPQNITISSRKITLENVFKLVEDQTGFSFLWNENLLDKSRIVRMEVKDAPLNTVMDICLRGLPLTYVIKDKVVMIEQSNLPRPFDSTHLISLFMPVTGRVTDAEGQPLEGVTIAIKGGKPLAVTDASGRFKLDAPDNAVLVFSFVGFATREMAVTPGKEMSISMAAASASLNEIVVTSFGIRKQEKSLGYATSTITAKELTDAGNTNFAAALYGKAPGVQVTTAPGGASSAVNVQIRGINSLNYNQQPLYVVDGVILRSEGQYGAAGRNNGGYYDDQRIRGNGILDVNPEDIESITILKGASATALYGSDAANGVVVVTTKKGTRGKGHPQVDVNYYGTVEQPAFLPRYQNVYGQGYDMGDNIAVGGTPEGWIKDTQSPTGLRPNFRAYADFGPKMEGQKVRWWDGSIRSYSPQPNNYRDIFRNGFSSAASVALSNQTDRGSYRVSASRLDYGGIQRASDLKKNTFSLNSSLKLSDKVSVDVIANYVNTLTHNRPYETNRLAQSFDGFFGREEDMNLVLDKFQTSAGYKWVPYNQTQRNPAEAFVFNVRPNLYDYLWTTLKNTEDETDNRLYSSITLNWDVINHLKFRGRFGNDFTSRSTEDKNYSEYPVAFNAANQSTGAYVVASGIYSIVYGDALLTYSNKLAKDLDLSVSGGFTSRSEHYRDQNSSTSLGLVTENWFSLSNSYGILTTTGTRRELLKFGYFGILDLSYKNYLFLEGTIRQESSSTLPPQNNTYFYPSVNGSFVFTDAFKDALPAVLSYGKLRVSYGQVANPAPLYASNIAYTQTSLQSINGSVASLNLPRAYGNSTLKPERKSEFETGLETRFLNDRLGLDVTFYTNRVKDQILNLQTSPSNGAASQIVNAGEIGSQGIEIGLNGTPLVKHDFRWQSRINFSFNRSKVYSLAPNIPQLTFYNGENAGIQVTAKPGEALGNIYVRPVATDAKGNRIVDGSGYYVIDETHYIKAGNILPNVAGGFSNTLTYKNFTLNVLVDYRLGGEMISTPLKYGISAGMYTSTLKYRDAEHGGLAYYTNSSGTNVAVAAGVTTGPAGETVYHDGVINPGVDATGKTNSIILDAADYYLGEYAAGSDVALNQDGAIYKNSYIKLRELSVGYRLPTGLVKRLGLTNVRISLIGRNLLYFYRTLKNLDPETTIGDRWYNQGIDNGSMPATRSMGVSFNATF